MFDKGMRIRVEQPWVVLRAMIFLLVILLITCILIEPPLDGFLGQPKRNKEQCNIDCQNAKKKAENAAKAEAKAKEAKAKAAKVAAAKAAAAKAAVKATTQPVRQPSTQPVRQPSTQPVRQPSPTVTQKPQ